MLMGNLTNLWLKRIFSVTTLTTLATVLAACIAVIQYVENNGGTFMAIVNNKAAKPPIARNILVFLDKDSADISQIGFFPQISNPSKYALQDVSLKYQVKTELSKISYSDYYTLHYLKDGIDATNIDKTLYAKSDIPDPFIYFIMHDNAHAFIKLRATYKGVDKPFDYSASIYAKKIFAKNKDERQRDMFDSAISLCKKHRLKEVDIFVLDNKNIQAYENFSKDTIKSELSLIKQAISESKTIEQLKADRRALKEDAQRKAITPWYMPYLYIILFIVCCIGFSMLFTIYKFKKYISDDILRKHLIMTLASIVTFIPGFYMMGLNRMASFGSLPFWGSLGGFVFIINLRCFLRLICKMMGVKDYSKILYFIIFLLCYTIFSIYYLVLSNNT